MRHVRERTRGERRMPEHATKREEQQSLKNAGKNLF